MCSVCPAEVSSVHIQVDSKILTGGSKRRETAGKTSSRQNFLLTEGKCSCCSAVSNLDFTLLNQQSRKILIFISEIFYMYMNNV